jgi:hypothetical protein
VINLHSFSWSTRLVGARDRRVQRHLDAKVTYHNERQSLAMSDAIGDFLSQLIGCECCERRLALSPRSAPT